MSTKDNFRHPLFAAMRSTSLKRFDYLDLAVPQNNEMLDIEIALRRDALKRHVAETIHTIKMYEMLEMSTKIRLMRERLDFFTFVGSYATSPAQSGDLSDLLHKVFHSDVSKEELSKLGLLKRAKDNTRDQMYG